VTILAQKRTGAVARCRQTFSSGSANGLRGEKGFAARHLRRPAGESKMATFAQAGAGPLDRTLVDVLVNLADLRHRGPPFGLSRVGKISGTSFAHTASPQAWPEAQAHWKL
jgi:hypothetical protein